MSFDAISRLEQPTIREKVLISRFWSRPEITVTVNQDRITVLVDMDEFLKALILEMGDPSWHVIPPEPRTWRTVFKHRPGVLILSQDSLATRVRRAAAIVLEKLKDATAQVM